MCTIPTIRLLIMMMSWVKAVFMLYIFSIGCYFASSAELQLAYGLQYTSYGAGLIFLGILSLALIYPMKFGVDMHNRFLMVLVFVLEAIVFAELIHIGTTVQADTIPVFAKSLQEDCLRNTPSLVPPRLCEEFYASDRTAGFRLLWAHYFSTKSDKFSYQKLATLQESGCCGFFPPFNCSEIERGFPANRARTGVSKALQQQRVSCGPYPQYYPPQDNCVDYYDFSANPPIVGGCRYDLGVGFCLTQDVEESSIGCASAMEDFAASLVAPHVPMIIGTSALNFLYMLIACCMWWKRKESDVFPRFLRPEGEAERVDYKKVKGQFELVAQPGLLEKEGFLPRKEGDAETAREGEGDEEAQIVNAPRRRKPGAPQGRESESGSEGSEDDDDDDEDDEDEDEDDEESES